MNANPVSLPAAAASDPRMMRAVDGLNRLASTLGEGHEFTRQARFRLENAATLARVLRRY